MNREVADLYHAGPNRLGSMMPWLGGGAGGIDLAEPSCVKLIHGYNGSGFLWVEMWWNPLVWGISRGKLVFSERKFCLKGEIVRNALGHA